MTDPQQPLSPSAPDMADEEEARAARLANRFDIRRLIGAVFLLYGLVLTALGVFGSSHVKNKAAGLNIDLWAGIGMLVFAALMLAWALLRPVEPDPPEHRGRLGPAPAGSTRTPPSTAAAARAASAGPRRPSQAHEDLQELSRDDGGS